MDEKESPEEIEAQAKLADKIITKGIEKEKVFAETVQVGDILFARWNESFMFSKFQYCTAGKGYIALTKANDHRSVECHSDIVGKSLWLSGNSVTHVKRGDKIVWDSRSLAGWHHEGKEYKGYILDFADSYLCELKPDDFGILVELITPFLEGKEGEKMAISTMQYGKIDITEQ